MPLLLNGLRMRFRTHDNQFIETGTSSIKGMGNLEGRTYQSSSDEPEHFRRIDKLKEFWEKVSLGQHYAVKRRWGFFHHFLIADVSASRGSVNVIHYTASNCLGFTTASFSPHGTVKEESLETDSELCKLLLDVDEGLYFIDDPSYRNRDPQQTINRARLRRKESYYDIRYNNCEHFVRWALTEEANCAQIDNMPLKFFIPACCYNEMKYNRHRLLLSAIRVLLLNLILFFVYVFYFDDINEPVYLYCSFSTFIMDAMLSSSIVCSLLYFAWKYCFEYERFRGIINPNYFKTLWMWDFFPMGFGFCGGYCGTFYGSYVERWFGLYHYVSPFYGVRFCEFVCGLLGDIAGSLFGTFFFLLLIRLLWALGLGRGESRAIVP